MAVALRTVDKVDSGKPVKALELALMRAVNQIIQQDPKTATQFLGG